MKKITVRKTVISAVMLGLSYVLPMFTGMIPKIGNMLCPMHIPVILTGFICGAPYGAAVGFIAPLLRAFTIGMPPVFPKGICMAFELFTYGLLSGILYHILPKKNINIYITLIISMLSGRAVWGAGRFICAGLNPEIFGISAFIAGGFTTSVPGIIVQIILIPIIIMALDRANLISK